MKTISIIFLAGGLGTRFGADAPKQFLPLNRRPVALYSFELFTSLDVEKIIVVCPLRYRFLFPKNTLFAEPGVRRQDSVWNALLQVSSPLVCIHDAARPLLEKKDLLSLIEAGQQHKAAALAVPVKSTIKESDEEGFVVKTLDRSHLFEIQTPQIATYDLLKEGFSLAQKNNLTVTDDVSLVELTGHRVKLVTGSYRNIKITNKEDLILAEALLHA